MTTALPARRHERTRDAVAAAVVFGFACAIFARTLNFGLYWDDNHHARPWTVSEVLATFHGTFDALGIEPAYFRPLLVVTFALDWAIWGWDAWGYHLTNVLLHAAASAAFYGVCRLAALELVPALGGALYFAAIPANAATAIYVSERSDAMTALFACLAIFALEGYRRERTTRWLVLENAMLLLGLCSKEIAVGIAGVLVLYWFHAKWRDEGSPRRGVVETWRELSSLASKQSWRQVLSEAALPCGTPLAVVIVYLGYRALVLPRLISEAYSSRAGPLWTFASASFWTFKAVPWEVRGLALPFLVVTVAALVFFSRPRSAYLKACVFGVSWVLATCLPLCRLGQVEPRLLYFPEMGHALVVAAAMAMLVDVFVGDARPGISARLLFLSPALLLFVTTAISLGRAQNEFLPDGPKMLHSFELVEAEPKRLLYPRLRLDEMEQRLRAAGRLPTAPPPAPDGR